MNVNRHFQNESKHSKKSKFFVLQQQRTAQKNGQHRANPQIRSPMPSTIQPKHRTVNNRDTHPNQKSMSFQRRIFLVMVLMCVFSLFVSLFVDVVILEHVSPGLAGPYRNDGFESSIAPICGHSSVLSVIKFPNTKFVVAHCII